MMKSYDNLLDKSYYTKEECLEPNQTVEHLWSWAKILEIVGLVGAILLLISGVYTAATTSTTVDASTKREVFDISLFLASFLKWLSFAALVFCSFYALALLISAIGNINYNTLVTAKVTLSSAEWHERAQQPSESPSIMPGDYKGAQKPIRHGFWICPSCGKRNNLNDDACACGAERPE